MPPHMYLNDWLDTFIFVVCPSCDWAGVIIKHHFYSAHDTVCSAALLPAARCVTRVTLLCYVWCGDGDWLMWSSCQGGALTTLEKMLNCRWKIWKIWHILRIKFGREHPERYFKVLENELSDKINAIKMAINRFPVFENHLDKVPIFLSSSN